MSTNLVVALLKVPHGAGSSRILILCKAGELHFCIRYLEYFDLIS